MQEVDILIIGGGAAGLMAASILSTSPVRVAILEKNRDFGTKLLITGKGRCNLTNMREWKEFSAHVHPDPAFLKTAFYAFSNKDLVAYLEKLGLQTKEERGMRVFPESDRSQDVRDTLKRSFQDKILVQTNAEVFSIHPQEHGFCVDYFIHAVSYRISAQKIILATGGLSYPSTGSTGIGYELARRLGHSLEPQLPSLTALIPENYDLRLVGSLLKNIKASLEIEGNIVQEEEGELQFTDGGIEGALGFRLSRKAVKAIANHAHVFFIIDLKPALTIAQIEERILREKKTWLKRKEEGSSISENKMLMEILKGFLPKSILPSFISSNEQLSLEKLPSRLKNWKFKIVDYVGYNRAVVTMGGVSRDGISRKTMESKLVPGLYFAGEVMDLDADTGGYNLQIAFSTAALSAKSALKSLSVSEDQ